MKILLAHVFHSPGVNEWYREVASSAIDGLEVGCFCVTLNPPGPCLGWKDLDKKWKSKNKQLMKLYYDLLEAAHNYDVLLLYNGANIHPEFLKYLPTFNVYCCFDDPENSPNLSAPVAQAFDAVFYGNIASRFQYESWGCKRLAWLPVFSTPSDVPSYAEGEILLHSQRDVPICFVGGKNAYRRRRLEMLADAFPSAVCFGAGWPEGKVKDPTLMDIYRRSKIGWNIHNSTGPINRRLFALAAYGVMQICDNKTGLGQIFRLGEEAVGFDTIPEAIELTRYYLDHEEERKRIAANGFRRYWLDYHPSAIWKRIKQQFFEWQVADKPRKIPQSMPPPKITDSIRFYGKDSLLLVRSFVRQARGRCYEGVGLQRPATATCDERFCLEEKVLPYIENPEMKGVNMAKERLAKGEPFEWPNMLALNWAVTSLIRDAKKIIEIGSGTGPFAEYASLVKEREIHCFEEDDYARSWAEQNRSHPNVIYSKYYTSNSEGKFDLLVSLDVFEHVADMRGFLSFCRQKAPRAIFSTPNRVVVRSAQDIGPPTYPPHVREFSPGEIYWILKQYYSEIFLYCMPDVYVPWLVPMDIATPGTPIIAECHGPLGLECAR